jgi:hypothetical protein
MKNVIRVFAIALLLAGMGSAKVEAQQGNWFWGLQYMVTAGVSDTKDFVSGGLSFRNFPIEGRYAPSSNVTVGLFFAWQEFNHETGETINLGGADARGVRAYAGAGAGTYYIENRLDIGRSAITVDNWHLGLAPEVGVIIPVDWNVRAYLNAKYNWAIKAGGIEHTFFSFGVGFAWM